MGFARQAQLLPLQEKGKKKATLTVEAGGLASNHLNVFIMNNIHCGNRARRPATAWF